MHGLHLDLIHGAVHDHPAALHDADGGAHVCQFRKNMGTDDDGLAQAAQVFQDFLDFKSGSWIQAGGRLIQQKQFRVMDQASCQAKSLLHTPGKTVYIIVLPVPETDQVHQVQAGLPCLFAYDSIEGCVEFHIFDGLEIIVNTEEIGHITDLPLYLLTLCKGIDSINIYITAARRNQACHHLHGGGLSCAVMAYKAKYLTLINLEVQMIHRTESAEVFIEIFNSQHRRHLRSDII